MRRKERLAPEEDTEPEELPKVVTRLLAAVKPLPMRVTVSPTIEALSIVGADSGLLVTFITILISGLSEEPQTLETERLYSPSERLFGTDIFKIVPLVDVASRGLLQLK